MYNNKKRNFSLESVMQIFFFFTLVFRTIQQFELSVIRKFSTVPSTSNYRESTVYIMLLLLKYEYYYFLFVI
jgi:hypothetical protein